MARKLSSIETMLVIAAACALVTVALWVLPWVLFHEEDFMIVGVLLSIFPAGAASVLLFIAVIQAVTAAPTATPAFSAASDPYAPPASAAPSVPLTSLMPTTPPGGVTPADTPAAPAIAPVALPVLRQPASARIANGILLAAAVCAIITAVIATVKTAIVRTISYDQMHTIDLWITATGVLTLFLLVVGVTWFIIAALIQRSAFRR